MAYVTRIGGDAEQVEYRLTGGHRCPDQQFDYRTDKRERPLRWIGGGLADVGIQAGSVMTEADMEKARALMAGTHPDTGETLVEAKVAVYDDAKLPLEPLVQAVRTRAVRAGISPDSLFKGKDLKAWRSAVRAVDGGAKRPSPDGSPRPSRLAGALRRADHAGQLADAAGISIDEIWGRETYLEAVRNLDHVETVVDEHGRSRTEITPRRKRIGVAGYDLTLTLPKSYSLLLAFSEPELADRIEAIYGQGVTDTVGWVERETAYQMRGHHGDGKTAEVVPTSGFLGWTMTHRAARPTDPGQPIGDPHWHIHVTLANLGRAEDGKWQTIAAGGRDLMRHAAPADKVVQALVRAELSESIGARFERSERTGLWEIAGFSDEVIRHFSSRNRAAVDQLREAGFDPEIATAQIKQMAAAKKLPKGELTGAEDETLRAHWLSEAAKAGFDVEQMARNAVTPELAQLQRTTTVEIARIRDTLADPETGLTSKKRRFSALDAIAAVAEQLPTGVRSVDDLIRLTNVVLDDPRFPKIAELGDNLDSRVRSAGNHDHEHLSSSALYTTADIVGAERQIAGFARQENGRAAVGLSEAQAAIAQVGQRGLKLGADQVRAITALVTSPAALDTIVGPPGTGKTTMLSAARLAWEARGFTVLGAATAAKAARGLHRGSGIESRTIAGLLHEADGPNGSRNPLVGVDVLVVDEASLTDDRSRARLYELADEAGTKVAEIGDPKQLRGVGCGSSFGVVHSALGGVELEANRRQLDAQDRAEIAAWREGQYAEAAESMLDRGRLRPFETSDEAQLAMLAEWNHRRQGAENELELIDGLLMLSATNDGVHSLNAGAQALRAQAGELGPMHHYLGQNDSTVSFATGDIVVFRQNDFNQELHTGDELVNGVQAVVTSADRTGVAVKWQEEDDHGRQQIRAAKISPGYIADGGLELGYAITVHRGQGVSVGGSWSADDGRQHRGDVLFDGRGADNPLTYVAISRAKGETVMFMGLDDLETPDVQAERGPIRDVNDLETRVLTELIGRAKATAENANDQPVSPELRDLMDDDLRAGRGTVREAITADTRRSRVRRQPGPARPQLPEPEHVYRAETAQGAQWFTDYGLHRDDGPAVERLDGSQEYWRAGQLHRDNGPAVLHADGTDEYWEAGQRLAPEDERAARLDTAAAELRTVQVDPADLEELQRIARSDQHEHPAASNEGSTSSTGSTGLTEQQRRQLDAAQQHEIDRQADQGRSDHL